MDFKKAKIRDIRKMLDNKEIGAVELANEYFSEIKKQDSSLNAFITVTEDIGIESAKNAQNIIDSNKSQLLTGVPVAVKDNFCTDGILTTCGSKMLEDFIPMYDATIVAKMKEQGYVLLGKTAMDEFAMGSTTQNCSVKTKNPLDTERMPGGSSGGSACAVAAGMAPIALGSDTGGSVRQPAAFCGITGIKPTYGSLSRFGVVAYSSSLDTAGILGKDAHDCALMLEAIAGHDRNDARSAKNTDLNYTSKIGQDIKGMKIALPKEFFDDGIDSEVKEQVLKAAKFFESCGAVIDDSVSLSMLKYAVPAYIILANAEGSSNLSKFDGIKFGHKTPAETYEEMIVKCRNEGFGAEVKRRILIGNLALSQSHYDEYFMKAMAVKQETYRQYCKVFETFDIIITPTTPTVAYKKGSKTDNALTRYQNGGTNISMNLAGVPAISIPCGFDSENIPVGMTITGKRFDEKTILQAADFFQKNNA